MSYDHYTGMPIYKAVKSDNNIQKLYYAIYLVKNPNDKYSIWTTAQWTDKQKLISFLSESCSNYNVQIFEADYDIGEYQINNQ